MRVSKTNNDDQGIIAVGALILTGLFMMIGLATANYALNSYTASRRSLVATNALAVAEAGTEEFMNQINQNSSYAGSGGDVVFFNDSVKGKGVYNTTVQSGALNNEKIIYSTGKIYLPANAASPLVTRKIKVIIRGTEPFNYAVQSGGTGALYLYGNTGITGKVYSNKFIRVQDKTVTLGGIITVADKDPDPTYSSWNCSLSGNNTVQSGSTLDLRYNVNNSHCGIDTTGSTVTQNDASVVAQPLPSVDKSTILAGITTNTPCTDISTAPLHIKNTNYQNSGTGSACDVNLSSNKNYTLDGSTYIKGNLTIDRNTISLDPSITSDVYVIVDGTITISGTGTTVATNANGVAITFVSYSNIDSVGSKIAANAISISGNSLSLTSRFLALNGSIGFTGRGTMGPVAANSIVMNGSGTINFTTISGVPQNSNTWYVQYYEQVFK